MGQCAACGAATTTESSRQGNAYRCTSTGQFGLYCKRCGTSWHTGMKPGGGGDIRCPSCGTNSSMDISEDMAYNGK